MNISFGARLRDGRRVGVEWRRRRTSRGTIINAVLTHDGELTAEDLGRALAEIAEGEQVLGCAERTPKRRRAARS